MNKVNRKKKQMLEALEKSMGIVTTACKSTGISRTTHYNWMHADSKYADAVNDITNVQLDFVESKLMDRINKGDTTAIIFYLNNKGKARGYAKNFAQVEVAKMPTSINFVCEAD